MKVVSFKYLNRQKKEKKTHIYCVGKVFKPLVLTMGAFILLFATNLLVNNFFAYMSASVKNFIESFVKVLTQR